MADGPPRGRVIVARKACREAIYQARKQKPRKEQAARIVYGSTMRLAKTLRGLAAKQRRSRRGAHIGARLTLMRFGSFRPIFGNFLWLLLALVSDVRPPKPWAHAPPTRPMRVPALCALCSCGLLTLGVSLCISDFLLAFAVIASYPGPPRARSQLHRSAHVLMRFVCIHVITCLSVLLVTFNMLVASWP